VPIDGEQKKWRRRGWRRKKMMKKYEETKEVKP
jgi:hypothetical protein